MRRLLVVFLCFWTTVAAAQAGRQYTALTPQQQAGLTEKIGEASRKMKTLECGFVQVKTISLLSDEMRSEGRLRYRQADKLRWEYTTPYVYLFVMNGGRVMIDSGRSKNTIDVSSSRVFREISAIILTGINGEGVFDGRKFTSRAFAGPAGYRVELVPKSREMKQMFSTISLTFNKSDFTVDMIEIGERGGDVTVITLKDKKLNVPISDDAFAVD